MDAVVITAVANTRYITSTHTYRVNNGSKQIEFKRELHGRSNSKMIFAH